MVDGAGKMATLKLTTQTGLHFYDGQMLWVNPSNSVTATAPRQGGGAVAAAGGSAGTKSTKALAIVDPKTGDELVVKKPEPEQKETTAASTTTTTTTTSEAPKSQAMQGFPGITIGSAPSAGATLLPGISIGNPTFGGLALSQFGGLSATPQILINPSSSTSIFAPHSSATTVTVTKQSQGDQTAAPNVLDLLAKATKTTPSTLLALSQPLISTPHPTSGSKGGRGDREDRNQGKAGKGGKSGGKAGKGGPTDGKGKGRGGRGGAGYTNSKDKDLEQKPRKKYDQVRNDGDKYTKDALYSASLDGRFWSLSCWPDGKRDETHGLTFGKHKLPVEGGVVKVVLFGGVNRYKIRLHLGKEGDEHVGESDRDGWSVAACEPNAANITLTEEAEKLGWKIHKSGEHPHIYPPGLEPPEASEESNSQDKDSAEKSSGEVSTTDKPVEEESSGEEKISEESLAEKSPEEPAQKPADEETQEKPTDDKPTEKPSGESQED
uniref:Uncharacterized protein n=1 Tax=Eutreptiella gymnastica TaxID=73025 RepID=A0A7S1I8Z5_9EUGL